MERFIVSARKYRPDSFESLIGQENIATTLKNSVVKNQLAHAYLFCGPRGVGKTSTARIFAKTINCSNPGEQMEPCGQCESCVSFAQNRSYSIHELDAASNNSVEDIRQLNELVRIPPQIGKYSVYIIDEVHMLSQSAFNAFLKTLEEMLDVELFVDGLTNIFNTPEYNDICKAKIFMEMLHRKEEFAKSLENRENGVIITIGDENPDVDMKECSLITATYHVEGKLVGKLGVIGPTRMKYGEVTSVIEFMTQNLESTFKLIGGFEDDS